MSKFKPGDKVRCVDSTGFASHELKSGHEYVVSSVTGAGSLGLHGSAFSFAPRRFELVAPEAPAVQFRKVTKLQASADGKTWVDVPDATEVGT